MGSLDLLPSEILEYILSNLILYKDLKAVRCVSTRFKSIVSDVVRLKQDRLLACILNSWKSVYFGKESIPRWICHKVHFPTEQESVDKMGRPLFAAQNSQPAKRDSHSSCYNNQCFYIFGGCSSHGTTFNDIWDFNLLDMRWKRHVATGRYPSPKAHASLVYIPKRGKENDLDDSLLLLFGGWSQHSYQPFHQNVTFFSELHMYHIATDVWQEITPASSSSTLNVMWPPRLAFHTATVFDEGKKVFIFGGIKQIEVDVEQGSQGMQQRMFTTNLSNDVWVFDIISLKWLRPMIPIIPRPPPRHGHSQLLISDQSMLIVGGINEHKSYLYNDIWLFHLSQNVWQRVEVSSKIESSVFNKCILFSNPVVKVGDSYGLMLGKPLKKHSSIDSHHLIKQRTALCEKMRAARENQHHSNNSDDNNDQITPDGGNGVILARQSMAPGRVVTQKSIERRAKQLKKLDEFRVKFSQQQRVSNGHHSSNNSPSLIPSVKPDSSTFSSHMYALDFSNVLRSQSVRWLPSRPVHHIPLLSHYSLMSTGFSGQILLFGGQLLNAKYHHEQQHQTSSQQNSSQLNSKLNDNDGSSSEIYILQPSPSD